MRFLFDDHSIHALLFRDALRVVYFNLYRHEFNQHDHERFAQATAIHIFKPGRVVPPFFEIKSGLAPLTLGVFISVWLIFDR
jgi:hypothetical protein